MQKVYINFPSITFALKSNKLLRLNHINSSVVRTPTQFSGCGCGHSIIIDESDLDTAKALLSNNSIVFNDIIVL